MIEKLDLAGYFLIVWDVVRFCLENRILVQGRGSAANSAVCYALSITAVDPVKMELLFERFLSEERGEWPDIDLDLPSGDQRERVIQHVYAKYGPHGAGMTANVITYRDRSSAREVAKALGYSPAQVDALSKQLGGWNFGEIRDPPEELRGEIACAGLDPEETRARHFLRLFLQIQNLPRHLGQHSGGIVVAAGRLDEVVPLEPASMPGRVVVQWDKDDCADLGIVKVDLLGLGMLAAIEEAIPMIRTHERIEVDLAHLPADDPAVYRMLNAADTVGLFQVESRAQMASLPRNAPKCFYDIVVQVAIIRPGPIVGGMVRPFFERRQGRLPVEYPHPCLEPILKRTLGVPLFQEQILRMAMVAAGFTGGEAEELRRAMGFKRSVERMESIEARLRQGMAQNGIGPAAQEQIVKSITSFALYGFPESHAASFALIAYASAYLKAHHPAAFLASLLNAWPMGFYHPATLVKDAQHHGTPSHPVDVTRSGWMCRWEEGAVRLGMRFVKGLREETGRAIETAQAASPFQSVEDLAARARLRPDELDRLAYAGALSAFGRTRRDALWQVAKVAREAGPLFAALPTDDPSPLPEMTPIEETRADYVATEITTGPHMLAHLRASLGARGVLSARQLRACGDGDRVTAAGAVIVRQRPGTAKGFVFLTLEDETGMVQAIVRPDLFQRERAVVVGSGALVVEGRLQTTTAHSRSAPSDSGRSPTSNGCPATTFGSRWSVARISGDTLPARRMTSQLLAEIGLAAGAAMTSGFRLYGTLAALGFFHRIGVLHLPPGAEVLSRTPILALSSALFVVEFLADKIPIVDTIWDAVHTFLRVPAAALLGFAALNDVAEPWRMGAALLCGTIALSAHGLKAGTRLALNASPEPLTNWTASFSEDALFALLVWLILFHPAVALVAALAVLAAGLVLLAWIRRGIRSLFSASPKSPSSPAREAASSRSPRNLRPAGA